MKRLADEETVVLNVKVPESLVDRVVGFQHYNNLKTKSEATRLVLERGLDAQGEDQ